MGILGINIYFRSYPIYLPQLKKEAERIVLENIRQSLMQRVQFKFGDYDPLAKEKIIKFVINDYLKSHSKEIKKQIQDLYLKMKNRYQDEKGQTYLMELDCWHWARYVENIVYLGHPGDEIREGKQFDKFMLAPLGIYLHWDNFLFYFSAFLYKIFSFFKFVPIYTFTFYLPLLFIAIFLTALYFFGFRLGGYTCGILASILIGLFSAFLPRSSAGWFDKDIFNLLFPLLVSWSYFESYNTKGKGKLFWIFLASFWIGVFCFTWLNWWFIFLFIIIHEASLIFYKLLTQFFSRTNQDYSLKENTFLLSKGRLFNLSLFSLFSFLWILILCGKEPFIYLYKQITDTIALTNPLRASIWPNVYSTVGELKKATSREIIQTSGGNFLFWLGVFSLIALFIRNYLLKKEKGSKRELSLFFNIWFLIMFYASLQGVRFIVFAFVPLGIAIAWLFSNIFAYFKKHQYPQLGIAVVLSCGIVLTLPSLQKADKIARAIYPLINDPWYKALILVNQSTPKEAILNSWWDFGDWFKVVAKRRVIFDGQSQNNPQAYWMAKVILNDSEKKALAILRMLNNGGNKAFDLILEYLKDPLRSVLLLENILGLEKEKAKEILQDFLPLFTTEKVISLLFDRPPPAYFIVEDSMIPKITAISYLGNWDFAKIYIAQNLSKEKQETIERLIEVGKERGDAERLYQEAVLITERDVNKNINLWFSRPVQFYSDLWRGQEKDGIVLFNNGFIYNKNEKKLYSPEGHIPRSLFYYNGKDIEEVKFPNANLFYSVLVFETKDANYRAIALEPQLAKSLFVRLYFLRGKGLTHFKNHIEIEEGKNYIGIYRIEW